MPNSLPRRPYVRSTTAQSRPVSLRRRLATLSGLGLAGLVAGLLSGCGLTSLNIADPAAAANGSSTTSWASLSGNWGFAAAAGTPVSATRLTSLGGSLAVNGASVTATLHALGSGQCLDSSELISLSGSVSQEGALSLSGQTVGGTAVKISGTVAADQRSLDNPTLTAAGGACVAASSLRSVSGAHPRDNGTVTAQQYQPVTGTYAGTLTTVDGESFSLTTTVTQVDQPDSNGTYHIQGSASAPGNPCLPSAVTATASVLSGGTLTATYSDGNGTAITASGYASADGSTLALTNWQITSSCGSDSGTATLTRQ